MMAKASMAARPFVISARGVNQPALQKELAEKQLSLETFVHYSSSALKRQIHLHPLARQRHAPDQTLAGEQGLGFRVCRADVWGGNSISTGLS